MAVVLGAFVPDTAKRWRTVAKGEVAQQLGVVKAARKMAARLEIVAAAVDDAEELAARGDKAAAEWLGTVRATTYEAAGAVDRFRVEGRQHRGREPQQQNHHQARLLLLTSNKLIRSLICIALQVLLICFCSSSHADSASAAILVLRQ
jgi:hypothetical protein